MQSLVDDAARNYDQVIIDGPPLPLVSDALVIASALVVHVRKIKV